MAPRPRRGALTSPRRDGDTTRSGRVARSTLSLLVTLMDDAPATRLLSS
jgi:hypothetical protein